MNPPLPPQVFPSGSSSRAMPIKRHALSSSPLLPCPSGKNDPLPASNRCQSIFITPFLPFLLHAHRLFPNLLPKSIILASGRAGEAQQPLLKEQADKGINLTTHSAGRQTASSLPHSPVAFVVCCLLAVCSFEKSSPEDAVEEGDWKVQIKVQRKTAAEIDSVPGFAIDITGQYEGY